VSWRCLVSNAIETNRRQKTGAKDLLNELDLGRGEVDSHAVVVVEEKEYQEERYMGEGGVWESTTTKNGRVAVDLVLV
jgi:hypothetical protein